MNIEIIKGRTFSIIVEVEGITDWEGLSSKLYISRGFELDGTIDDEAETITFDFIYDITKTLNNGRFKYEVVLFNDDKSYIKNVTKGYINISEPLKINPTE